MILTSQIFDTFDRCGRRLALEREYESLTTSPLGLLYKAVESAIAASDVAQGVADEVSSITKHKDVQAGDLSPISAVRHVSCMAEVIGLALKTKLGKMKRVESIPIGEHLWESNLFETRGGILHRIVFTAHLDDDSLRSFAHSWQTIGELAAIERPINLTAVVIGSQRGGRRHTPWAKGFIHPVQKNLRFGRRKAKADGFTDGWKEVWREQSEIKAETWFERMQIDDMVDELIVTRKVQYREDDARMVQAKSDMLALIPRIEAVDRSEPMRRSSCDELGRGACPFQPCCYSATLTGPEDLPHLYRIRDTHPEATE